MAAAEGLAAVRPNTLPLTPARALPSTRTLTPILTQALTLTRHDPQEPQHWQQSPPSADAAFVQHLARRKLAAAAAAVAAAEVAAAAADATVVEEEEEEAVAAEEEAVAAEAAVADAFDGLPLLQAAKLHTT